MAGVFCRDRMDRRSGRGTLPGLARCITGSGKGAELRMMAQHLCARCTDPAPGLFDSRDQISAQTLLIELFASSRRLVSYSGLRLAQSLNMIRLNDEEDFRD